ncbi:MAG: hypothetical protein VKI81_01580 [Synechococcaceae cyanobacterium]|nr:hypothetical protein [Synechococcaceae cyanobacterium]
MGYRETLASGRVAFAHLIRLWHARNGWSHRVLPALAEALDLGKVHNSQLSMLRNGKLASPGPEVFLALGGVNRWLADHAPDGRLDPADPALEGDGPGANPELLEALRASALPVIGAAGEVLGPGELLEIFGGLRQPPPAFDLRIDEGEASALSGALAMVLTAGRPWRQCRDQLLAAYPVGKRQRRERFAEVMAGQRDYTATELDAELPDLRRTLAALGAAGEQELGPDRFLELLRRRARLEDHDGGGGNQDLALAIRRELDAPPVAP